MNKTILFEGMGLIGIACMLIPGIIFFPNAHLDSIIVQVYVILCVVISCVGLMGANVSDNGEKGLIE